MVAMVSIMDDSVVVVVVIKALLLFIKYWLDSIMSCACAYDLLRRREKRDTFEVL